MAITGLEKLHAATEAGHKLKPPAPADALEHMNSRQGEFWRSVPKYKDVDEKTFLDHLWQYRNSVKTVDEIVETVQDLVEPAFIEDMRVGFHRAPMNVRVSPYAMALIDWKDPYNDPIRTQFIPLRSRLLPDHPKLTLDSLHELDDSPVVGLTHRYVDKALFLPTNVCPVYCRFCTRSYAIGGDTDVVEKSELATDPKRWQQAFDYIASRPELQDIVISGGDAYNLRPTQITEIGETLLARGDPAARQGPLGLMLHFAYGANMHCAVMRRHAPGSIVVLSSVSGIVAHGVDVTVRKIVEEQRQQAMRCIRPLLTGRHADPAPRAEGEDVDPDLLVFQVSRVGFQRHVVADEGRQARVGGGEEVGVDLAAGLAVEVLRAEVERRRERHVAVDALALGGVRVVEATRPVTGDA